MKQVWSPLTHQVFRWFREQGLEGREHALRIGVGVSGGADSVALITILNQLKSALHLELYILHVHHGERANLKHRQEAQSFVENLASQLSLPLLIKKSHQFLKSEKALRDFRRQAFREWIFEHKLDWVATGHHAQDLLETRILRMLRGTGAKGLPAILAKNKPWLRPFLSVSPRELRADLKRGRQTWLEDESNQDPRYLRNWVRQVWLPALEQRCAGAVERWGVSLETLAEVTQVMSAPDGLWLRENTLSRSHYHRLTRAEQRQAVAQLFWRLKSTDYSQAQIEEVRKRLDNSQNAHTFTVSRLLWQVNAQQILVSRPD